MTNKLVFIINSLKVPKIKKILLYEMKFPVPNYSCLQNPWLGAYCSQIPVLSVLCPQMNLLNPPQQNSWVRHCLEHISGKPKGEIYGKNITNHIGMFMFSSVPCITCVTIVVRQFSHEQFTDIYSDSWLSKQGWCSVNNIWDFHDTYIFIAVFWVIYHGTWSGVLILWRNTLPPSSEWRMKTKAVHFS